MNDIRFTQKINLNKENVVDKWKGLAICGIWIGYALAIASVAFGTHDPFATMIAAVVGIFFAAIATNTIR